MYVCMYVCSYVCMYLCMYVCIYAQTAITKKIEVETRLKFTIRYKMMMPIAVFKNIEQSFFYSNLIPRISKISSPIGFCTTKTDVNFEKEKET